MEQAHGPRVPISRGGVHARSKSKCYVLATAKINSAIAVFKKEQEIVDELNKKPFDVNIKLY
ncbi:MAG: hypothetical protein ACTSRG_20380 [Candidatus Helarchaeota archaeon]